MGKSLVTTTGRRAIFATSFLLALFAANAIWTYVELKQFPDRERRTLEAWISAGEIVKCNPDFVSSELKMSVMAATREFERSCYPRAQIEEQILNPAPGKPEYDQVYFHFACSTNDISARFQIVTGRTDSRLWCQYRLGEDLNSVSRFRPNDVAVVSAPASWLERTLSRLAD